MIFLLYFGSNMPMVLDDVLFPEIELINEGDLKVSELHTIHWEESGNLNGHPVIVLHGGPGGGSQPMYRRYFNPEKYRIIQFDQRGCGKSTPHAELRDNNTMASVSDIEKLREHLGISDWIVFGGSWGSTLSLIYAETHPKKVQALILRGIFMCRPKELHWFYQDGASHIFPDAFAPYKNHIPKEEQDNLILAYYNRLTSDDMNIRKSAAFEWTRWEMSTSKLIPDTKYIEAAEDSDFADAFARIESHYFINGIFLDENQILRDVNKIKHIPTWIIQGRYDVVCPPRSAWELKQELDLAKLVIVPDAGHSVAEIPIASELIKATNECLNIFSK